MNIAQLRADTPGCNQVIHFNNAGAALMPHTVAEAIRRYITEEEYQGGYETAEKNAAAIREFYAAAAQLLHCNSSNIAFTTNATDSYNRALSSVAFKPGDVVLLSENDYPSNYIVFLSLQKRTGIQLVTVKNTGTGEIDLADLEAKLRQYHPRLLSVTHVPTSSGLVQPVEAIGNIVRQYDTLYLLDACQSIGQLPVNAPDTQADFISGTFRKFLRGPRGAGWLYVSDKALQAGLEPLYIDLNGADWTSVNSYQPHPGAKRFEDWETAYALLMGSKEALQYLLDIGIEKVEARNNLLATQLRNALAGIPGVQLQDRGTKTCNIITFSITGKEAAATKQYFRDKGINIYTTTKGSAVLDFAEKGVEWVVRASPHYYNTENEIDIFIEAVKALL